MQLWPRDNPQPTCYEKTSHGPPTRSLHVREGRPTEWVGLKSAVRQIQFLRNALEMVVLAPRRGASDTYGQISGIGADTMRAPRYSSTRVSFTVKRMSTETVGIFPP